MTSAVDIRPDHLAMVRDILRAHLPAACKVWVFGSRANWTTKDSSDLDLAVEGVARLDHKTMSRLEAAFEESNLPYAVDVVDINAVGHAFKQIVEEQRAPLSLDGDDAGQPLPNGWREVRLGDVVEFNDETYSSQEDWSFINYLDTGSITENRISQIQRLEVGKDEIPSRARRKVQLGDIAYSMVRPNQRHFGLLKIVPDNFVASTGFAVLRGLEGKVDTGFLYWFLAQNHIVDYLHSIAENSTSAYPSIRPSDLEHLALPLPPLSEQRAIAHVLGTLDDKIELNRRMNETLEAMARALFKSWFVDFEPVRAKAEGRDTGLPPEVAALFPDRLVESELGQIPAGWEVGILDDMIEILSGGTPRTSVADYWNGDVPWYTAKDAPSLSDVYVLRTERTITQAGIENSAASILPAGTTTITARGTVGRLACLGIPMAINQTCYGIRGASGYPDMFTYWNVRTAVDELQARSHGTIFDTITRQTFKFVDAVLVPQELARTFESTVKSWMERILDNLQEAQALVAQRDILLPGLVSGERRVIRWT